jgi:hypothetical protein
VLGLCLLTATHRVAVWLITATTFSAFGYISISLGLAGRPRCSCFGSLDAGPWTAFAIDVAALALLIAVRPKIHNGDLRRSAKTAFKMLSSAAVLAFALGFAAQHGALSGLPGRTLVVAVPAKLDLGVVEQSSNRVYGFSLQNRAAVPVVIHRIETSCECLSVGVPERAIPAGGQVRAYVELTLVPEKDVSGSFRIDVKGYTANQELAFELIVEFLALPKDNITSDMIAGFAGQHPDQ